MRRLIYSQLPLPLGTLPRNHRMSSTEKVAGPTVDDIEGTGPDTGPTVARVYGRSGPAKSTESGREYRLPCIQRWKLPLFQARETSTHERS